MMKPPRTEQEAVAPISIFWDIVNCPVPDGYDPCRVGPCIKRFLNKLGYSGPVNITAVGILACVPVDILRGISSTGIALTHTPLGSRGITSLVSIWTMKNKPPANVMLISLPPTFSYMLGALPNKGYNTIFPFTYDDDSPPQEAAVL